MIFDNIIDLYTNEFNYELVLRTDNELLFYYTSNGKKVFIIVTNNGDMQIRSTVVYDDNMNKKKEMFDYSKQLFNSDEYMWVDMMYEPIKLKI